MSSLDSYTATSSTSGAGMKRREFIGLVSSAAAVWPLLARAQQPKGYRVGFLLGPSGESVASLFHALKEGLRERRYVEGRNIAFEQRYGDGKMERLPDLAAELVRLKVDVIVTGTNLHVVAVRHATSTIPIVMVYAADPVGAGFVASLARPGGNVTGIPVRPFLLAVDQGHAGPAKSFAADGNSVTPSLSTALHVVEVVVQRIDNDGAARLSRGVLNHCPAVGWIDIRQAGRRARATGETQHRGGRSTRNQDTTA